MARKESLLCPGGSPQPWLPSPALLPGGTVTQALGLTLSSGLPPPPPTSTCTALPSSACSRHMATSTASAQ